MDIYLDTNLWNELFRQHVVPESLLTSLGRKNVRLVLSDENVFELARTFMKKDPNAPQEGTALFSYLKEFTSRSIPVTKDNMALVAAEMWDLKWRLGFINPFITPDDYEKVGAVIEDHAAGGLKLRTRGHIEWRASSGASDRAGLVLYLEKTPLLKQALLRVSPKEFPSWVRRQRSTQDGINYLAWQIKQYFEERPFGEVYEYACALQSSPVNRVSMGLITRNFYFNWRTAHRSSIPKDLFPDSNHIINANYCDIYATKEGGQAEYAALLLTSATSVCVYNTQKPIDEWLLSLN